MPTISMKNTVITYDSNNNPRQKSPISQSPIQSIKSINIQDSNGAFQDTDDSETSDDHEQELEEERPIEKPDAFIPGYIYQLEKAGRFNKVQEVLKEHGYPPDPAAASGMLHTV